MRPNSTNGSSKAVRNWRALVALGAVLCLAAASGSAARADAADVCPSGCAFSSIQAAIAAASPGATITVGAGTYTETEIDVNVANLTLTGLSGAKVVVPGTVSQVNAFDVRANDVTIQGFDIAGPATSSYLTYAWGGNIPRGIFVPNGVTGFTIADNDIHDVRNGILVDGRNTGSITGNTIENTKSAVSIQYTDFAGSGGSGIVVSGNKQGQYGNEWGVNVHLNGNWDGTTIHSNPYPGGAAPSGVQQTLLDDSTANSGWTVQDQAYTSSNRTAITVAPTTASPAGSPTAQGSPLNPISTVQAGLDGVVSGGTVNVTAGTYAENVTVSKKLTLSGAGASQTTISGTTGYGITLGASSSGTTIENLTVSGFLRGIDTESSGANDITLAHLTASGNVNYGVSIGNGAVVSNWTLNDVTATGNGVGMRVRGLLTGLTIEHSHLDSNGEGLDSTTSTGQPATLSNVTVTDTTFDHDTAKGMYFEALDHASFDRVEVVGSGVSGASPIGVDVNLKYASYSTISFANSTISGSTGTGIYVKGRNDSSYASVPASLSGVTLTSNTITGNAAGVAVENDVTGVKLRSNDLSGNTGAGLRNSATTTVDATGNWWGSTAGPGAVTGATTKPWCTDSSCVMSSDDASLTALSLSGGTLSPSYASTITSYTASVPNATTAVTASATPVVGATATVAGGSSLAVGANTVTITVASADGSATRVYTVTVTRAAGAASPTATTPATTTTAATTTTSQPTEAATVVNQPQSKSATPGQAGTVAVVVAPAASSNGIAAAAPVSVGLSWTPAAFTVPVTVQVTPKPQAVTAAGAAPAPTPVAGGFSVGSTVVQVNVTTASGQAVTQFAAPLVLHVSAMAPGQVPAYSHDGTTWTTIPKLSAPDLPAGQQDGYFANADGSVDIYTRHATLFGLLLDTKAPARPRVTARVSGHKLRLTVRATDNVRIASYRVLVNGKLVKRTVHAYLAIAARAGRIQVVAVDTAGNRSAASAATVVARTKSKRQPFRIGGTAR